MRHILLREAGGLGDVLRTFPVARGLKRLHPGCRVEYVCLAGYEDLVRLSPDVDAVHTVTVRERRPRDAPPDPARHAYLRRFTTDAHAPETRFVDLCCPAYRHEVETDGEVTLDRVELFCRAGGVEPSTPRITVPAAERNMARGALTQAGGDTLRAQTNKVTPRSTSPGAGHSTGGPRKVSPPFARAFADRRDRLPLGRRVLGLGPYATHVARSWLGRGRLVELARELSGSGCRLVLFHSWKLPRPGRDEATARDIGAYPALRLPWPELAARVAACDLVIAVDTGILHLAGALGVPTLGLFGPTSGEVICRPYPTIQPLQASPAHGPSPRLQCGAGRSPTYLPREMERCAPATAQVRLSARARTDTGCLKRLTYPCYCRRSRGYSPEVCGRAGCELLNRLTPEDVIARLADARLQPQTKNG